MAPDNEPATRADLDAVRAEMKGIRDLLENELRHLREDVNANTEWRLQFTAENGPWRRVADNVKIMKVFVGVLSPVALWAVIEIIKAAWAFFRGGA